MKSKGSKGGKINKPAKEGTTFLTSDDQSNDPTGQLRPPLDCGTENLGSVPESLEESRSETDASDPDRLRGFTGVLVQGKVHRGIALDKAGLRHASISARLDADCIAVEVAGATLWRLVDTELVREAGCSIGMSESEYDKLVEMTRRIPLPGLGGERATVAGVTALAEPDRLRFELPGCQFSRSSTRIERCYVPDTGMLSRELRGKSDELEQEKHYHVSSILTFRYERDDGAVFVIQFVKQAGSFTALQLLIAELYVQRFFNDFDDERPMPKQAEATDEVKHYQQSWEEAQEAFEMISRIATRSLMKFMTGG